jgi:Mg-chelatase subunit ChlI
MIKLRVTISGKQGSGKTLLADALIALLDPTTPLDEFIYAMKILRVEQITTETVKITERQT